MSDLQCTERYKLECILCA